MNQMIIPDIHENSKAVTKTGQASRKVDIKLFIKVFQP